MSVAIRSKDINTDALDLDAFLVLKELFPTETDDDIARLDMQLPVILCI